MFTTKLLEKIKKNDYLFDELLCKCELVIEKNNAWLSIFNNSYYCLAINLPDWMVLLLSVS